VIPLREAAPRDTPVVVLMGGSSPERDVSLASGAQVAQALEAAGYPVTALDVRDETLPQLVAQDPVFAAAHCVFPILHGGAGEDGTVQSLLDLARIPYVGSDRVGCTLSMDKEISKRLFRDAGIPTPEWCMGPADLDEVEAALGLPVIVKPPSAGSTVGLTLAHDRNELEAAVPLALSVEPRILFERYIRGRELTVGILGGVPLPVGEIIPAHEIFDYACKYEPGLAEEIFPAAIEPEVALRAQALALRVHALLQLRDVSRVDFMLDGAGELWCLEANALPGMTPNSLLPKAAAAAGMSFPDVCHGLVQAALRRGPGGGPQTPEGTSAGHPQGTPKGTPKGTLQGTPKGTSA
jgi:D-alanine-D-alanine ligase